MESTGGGWIAPPEKTAICSTLDRGQRAQLGPARWRERCRSDRDRPLRDRRRLRRPRGRRRRGADGRRGGAGREGQDGRRLPELRLRTVQVADRRRQGRADDPHRGSLRGQRPRAGDRLRGGPRARPWRDRSDRAARFGSTLRGPGRQGAARASAFHWATRDRGRRPTRAGQALRDRDRLVAGGPGAAGPGRGALSDQRDDLRSDRAPGASDRARRRSDRLRTCPGPPAARRQDDDAPAEHDPAQGRPGRDRGRAPAAAGRRDRPARAGPGGGRRARGQRRRGRGSGRRRSRSGSSAAISWSRPAGPPTSMAWASRPRASTTASRASRSMPGCAPATSGSTRSATSRAATSSPTWRPITPAS